MGNDAAPACAAAMECVVCSRNKTKYALVNGQVINGRKHSLIKKEKNNKVEGKYSIAYAGINRIHVI
jgi:hypothetical protein